MAFCQAMCVFSMGAGREEQKCAAVSQDCNLLLSLHKTVADPSARNILCLLLLLPPLNGLTFVRKKSVKGKNIFFTSDFNT